ncbi:MAG: DNA polymerase Y family protein [Niabella sp.]
MCRRFVSIWFRYLKSDWMVRHNPELNSVPFVLASPQRGRIIITEVSAVAKKKGLYEGMPVADAKVVLPEVQIHDDKIDLSNKLLNKLAVWCIKYTPVAAIDLPDGLILDISGCAHLWGGEEAYLKSIINQLKELGYHVRAAMADTIGTAWAVCRYGKEKAIIKTGEQTEALMPLPPAALRLETKITERLQKLGFFQIKSFMNMHRSALRRRLGEQLLLRLDQALGYKDEIIKPVIPIEPYREYLPCLEPIQTVSGIEIALQKLLDALCRRLQKESKGLRNAIFKCYRIDSYIEQIKIRTNHPSSNVKHLFRLFEIKIATIEPALGIELFALEALKVEDIQSLQEGFWTINSNLECKEVAELLDSLESKFGNNIIHRYLPDEHHLPERSIKLAESLKEKPTTEWKTDKPIPIQLLQQPEPVEVMAPIPDYPPMHFRHKGQLHTIRKADGPERIEAEWWIQDGEQRDYYVVEDETGKRYWIFRMGHYTGKNPPRWYLHGFFA